jgi:hypothetical protein
MFRRFATSFNQGCHGATYQNGKNIPNYHKIYQHLPLKEPQKIYPNFDFWFENIPSGNPAFNLQKLDVFVI